MKIAIIGGSIAGCALALLLKDKYEVILFERSNDLKSRGAGLTFPVELLHVLKTKNLIDHDMPLHSLSARSFYCQSPNELEHGQFLWHQPISLVGLHWDTLFTNLRKRISNSMYRQGCKVTEVHLKESTNQLVLESGETLSFDLIVFADGAQSLGRALISDPVQPKYSGYVGWRCTLDFDLINNKSLFNDQVLYYCFNKGHLLTYPVYHHQTYKLNWVFYEKLTLECLEALGPTSLTDFSAKAKEHVHQLARSQLPKIAAQIILDTPSPFVQKIVDVCVNRLAKNRALLLGDASAILRPHVGNGAALAIQDALSFSEQLSIHGDFDQAIAEWEKNALPKRLAIYDLSKRMADALVLNPVHWQEMNAEKMAAWWEQIIRGEKWCTTTVTKA